jgi:dTDP-glucose 4,6-dehydratase
MQPDDGRMVPNFITQALADQPCTVTGDGGQTRSICYVSDTVAGLLSLARSSESGPINIGNPVELTVTEIASLVAEIIGSQAGIHYLPAVIDDPQRRCPDITRAVERLDWRPLVQLDEGLKQDDRLVRGTVRLKLPLGFASPASSTRSDRAHSGSLVMRFQGPKPQ